MPASTIQAELDELTRQMAEVTALVSDLHRKISARYVGDLVTTPVAEQALGLNRKTLYERIKSGLYREGIEVHDASKADAQRPDWRWDIAACRQRSKHS